MRLVDEHRAEFDHSVTKRQLEEIAAHARLAVLQCSAPVDDRTWLLLNECFFPARPDVELRVYGHYAKECDLGFVRHMTNVRRFAADSLRRARNVDAIAAIPHLESLGLGIFELEDFGVLERLPPTLMALGLCATRSKKPGLAALRRFRQLRTLFIEGHSKDIEVLGELPELEEVTLRSITTPDLRYLTPLRKLWSLDIKLGGIRSFEGVERKESIRYLELWRIRELKDIRVVATLPNLENLFLQNLPHIEEFPSLADAKALRRVVIDNLKGLRDFGAFESAPALEEFALIFGNRQTPEQLLPVLRNPATRRVIAFFGSKRKNQAFHALREQHAKVDWAPSAPFEYRPR